MLALLAETVTAAAEEPPPAPELRTEANAFIWAAVRRWPNLCRAFLLLFKAGLVDEARLVGRAAAELAINAVWVIGGRAIKTGLYATAEERAKALEEDSRAATLQWWKALKVHDLKTPLPEMIAGWEASLAGAAKPPGLPDLRARAIAVSAERSLPLQLYEFGYRLDSDVTHSNTWSLISGVRGQPQIHPDIATFNAGVAAMLLLGAGAIALKSPRLETEATRLREAIHRSS